MNIVCIKYKILHINFMYVYNFFFIDITRCIYSIVDFSTRLGGKPLLELSGSLSVPNIGKKLRINN